MSAVPVRTEIGLGWPPSPETEPRSCIDFGGVTVLLTSDSNRWIRLAEQRYRGFQVSGGDALRVVYRPTRQWAPGATELAAARLELPGVNRQGGDLVIEAPSFSGKVDLSSRQAELEGPMATFPVDLLLRSIWPCLVERGLIFHAAALAWEEEGWLCCGPSGSGKSTLAGLLDKQALCDELVAIRTGPDGPRLFSLPFWNGRAGSARLSGIYLLRHAAEHSRQRLPVSDATKRLSREISWPMFDPELMRRSFETVTDLVSAVPVWELGFRPEREVWKVLRGAG